MGPSLTDTVEKGFWGRSLSNIDSRSNATAQSRFKNPFVRIRLFQILIPQLHFGDFFNSIDPFQTSRFADERFSNRHKSEHRHVSRWPSVPSGNRLSLSVAASVCVFSLCFKKRQVSINQFRSMKVRIMPSDNRVESEVECFQFLQSLRIFGEVSIF